MTEIDSFKSRIKPSTETHAIEVMALAFEWEKPLDPEILNAAIASIRSDKSLMDFLPTEKTFPGFEFKLNGQDASVLPKNMEIVDFEKVSEAGRLAWSISVRPEFFSCSCGVYDSWANVKPIAIDLLYKMTKTVIHSGIKLQAIGLQYADVFRWNKSDEAALKDLLRVGSKYLPSSIFSNPSLWHTHNGWFSSSSDDYRILNLLNIDLVDEKDLLALKIHGQHRFQAISFEKNSLKAINVNQASDILDVLHLENKVALMGILSDTALAVIGMES